MNRKLILEVGCLALISANEKTKFSTFHIERQILLEVLSKKRKKLKS